MLLSKRSSVEEHPAINSLSLRVVVILNPWLMNKWNNPNLPWPYCSIFVCLAPRFSKWFSRSDGFSRLRGERRGGLRSAPSRPLIGREPAACSSTAASLVRRSALSRISLGELFSKIEGREHHSFYYYSYIYFTVIILLLQQFSKSNWTSIFFCWGFLKDICLKND